MKTYRDSLFNIRIMIIGLFAAVVLMTIIFTPPFQSPDSFAHFNRSIAVSEGQLVGIKVDGVAGGYLPNTLDKFEIPFQSAPFHPTVKFSIENIKSVEAISWTKNTFFVNYASSTVYEPLFYVPSGFALLFAKLFNLKIMFSYYLVEIVDAILCLLILYFALKKIPNRFLFLISVFLFTPEVFTLVGSNNPDGIMISLSVLLGACFIDGFGSIGKSLKNSLGSSDSKNFEIALLSFYLIAFYKPPYILMGLLFFNIDFDEGNFRNYAVKTAQLISPIVIFDVLWQLFGYRSGGFAPIGVNISEQIKQLATQPYSDVLLLFHTLRLNGLQIWKFTIGVFGWGDTYLPNWFYIVWTLLIMVAIRKVFKNRRSNKIFILSMLIFLLTSVVVLVSMYVTYTPVGFSSVIGFQGRYFLPLVIPCAISAIKYQVEDMQLSPAIRTMFFSFALVSFTVSIYTLTFRFWQ